MYYIYILVIFIIVISLLIMIQSVNNELVYQKSSIDNKNYLVRNDERKLESANYMAQIHQKLELLLEHIKVNAGDDPRVKLLLKKYDADNISESMKSSIYTSYSVNKGEKLVICIKEKDPEESFIDMNTVMFVIIHELAHVITKSIGHTKEFWDNMKYLLEEGEKIGIYTPEDYSKKPKMYCGLEINSSPYKFS